MKDNKEHLISVFITDSYPGLPKPLPCPFCGKNPIIQKDKRYPEEAEDEGCSAYEVICHTYGCPVYYADNSYYKTPEEAIETWNRRRFT